MKKIFFLASVVCAGLFAMVSCGDKDEELNDDRGGNGSEGIVIGHGDHMIAGIIANETVLSFCDPYFLFEHDGKVDSFACNAPEVEAEEVEIGGVNYTAYVVEKEIKSRPVTIRVKTSEKPDFDQKFADFNGEPISIAYLALHGNSKEWNEEALKQTLKHNTNIQIFDNLRVPDAERFRSSLSKIGGSRTIE